MPDVERPGSYLGFIFSAPSRPLELLCDFPRSCPGIAGIPILHAVGTADYGDVLAVVADLFRTCGALQTGRLAIGGRSRRRLRNQVEDHAC
jgi:hypothetical protein